MINEPKEVVSVDYLRKLLLLKQKTLQINDYMYYVNSTIYYLRQKKRRIMIGYEIFTAHC